jgi:hypothetical protein
MANRYIGDATWQRQPDARSGFTPEGLFYYELFFMGRKSHKEAFRSNWKRGASCPLLGYDHLELVASPEIIEGKSMAWATLRFEGFDINGEFTTGEDRIRKSGQEREVNLSAESTEQKGTYMYIAPLVTVSYTLDYERSKPKAAPSMDDPEPQTLVTWEKGLSPLQPKDLIDAHKKAEPPGFWTIETISGFTDIENDGGGWVHNEWHTKLITAAGIA